MAIPFELLTAKGQCDILQMPSFCCCEAKGISSLSLMPQIQCIMAWSLQQIHISLGLFGPHASIPWSIAEQTHCILGDRCLVIRTNKHFLTLAHTTQHLVAIALSGAQHIPQVAGSGFHLKHCVVNLHCSRRSAIDGLRLTFTPGADIDFIGNQSLNYTTALLLDPQHTWWAQYGVAADTTTADGTGVHAKFLEDIVAITRDQELGLLYVDTEPFTFHASLPHLELGDTLLLCVHDEHQTVSIKKLPWYTNVERMRNHLQHQNEGQWTKDSTTPNPSLYWPPTRTGLWALEYIPWMACTARSSTPRLLKAYHRTFLDTQLKAFSRSMKAK